ncbi:MAG: 23S rRNA (adenine(2503)-C(2))-methyltransferase RlmN [Patescibacteria group bacterium]
MKSCGVDILGMGLQEAIEVLSAGAPAYRVKQIEQAFFNPKIKDWSDITVLAKNERQKLEALPFFSFKDSKVLTSRDGSFKAVLELLDGQKIETVLMPNTRGHWTICLSTQVGCARGCGFCATGTMGLVRNLSVDEIVDQYRFWSHSIVIPAKAGIQTGFPIRSGTTALEQGSITNLVFMGMGEPLDNYESVKTAINLILKYTEIGPTRITVSTVGVWPTLDTLLSDKDWSPVRLAISLHGADAATRKKIVPSTPPDFFEKLTVWSKNYLKQKGNRRHYLTFEYIMISGVNDSLVQAEKLAALTKEIFQVRINLVPCNPIGGHWQESAAESIDKFQTLLEKEGITVTVRRSMGQDIAAACGQLVAKK